MPSRFQLILMARIESAHKATEKRNKIRHAILGIQFTGYFIVTVLVFIGLITLLNPYSRFILVHIIKSIL